MINGDGATFEMHDSKHTYMNIKYYTWNRHDNAQSSSFPLRLTITLSPLTNCRVFSFWTAIFIFSLVYCFSESQQAIALGVSRPKNRFPLLSMAWAVACTWRCPISWNSLGQLSTLLSQAVALFSTSNRTLFSVLLANAWKYKFL